MHGFISGITILFHWSVYLFLCQYDLVLITVALQYSLKSGNMIPLAFFFFPKIVLALQGLLYFYKNFKIIWSSSVKNSIDIFFIKICIESLDCFGYYDHFNSISSSGFWTWYTFPCICVSFSFFHQLLTVFQL